MAFTHMIEFDDLPFRISGVEVGGACLIGKAKLSGDGIEWIELCPASARDGDISIGRSHRLFRDLSESIAHHCAEEIEQFWADYDPPADRQSYADEHRLRQYEVL